MTLFHRYLGSIIVLLFVVIFTWAMALWAMRRETTPTLLRGAQHWTENLLLVQTLTGVVLLTLGRRVEGPSDAWLHYLYGSLFPLIAMVGGRLAALRRERRAYLGLAWGSFFAFGLTLRAVQTACGAPLADLLSCMLR
jgi:succinate dehydrogenase/fumarate reductase cytochrome b subunit